MKIYLVRHAEKEDIGENPNLTKRGMKQARGLAKRLKKKKFSKFYCSDMNRAKQTAEIVSKKIKLKPKIEEPLKEYESLDIKRDEKKLKKSERSRKKKMLKFIDKITKNPNKEENILIIAHGITNRIILAHLLELPLKKVITFRQHNTGINHLNWSEKFKNWQLRKMNDIEHVPRRLR